jgi:hypothetical protein
MQIEIGGDLLERHTGIASESVPEGLGTLTSAQTHHLWQARSVVTTSRRSPRHSAYAGGDEAGDCSGWLHQREERRRGSLLSIAPSCPSRRWRIWPTTSMFRSELVAPQWGRRRA